MSSQSRIYFEIETMRFHKRLIVIDLQTTLVATVLSGSGWSVMAVPDGFRDEASVDGAFLDAARLTASSLLFA